MKTTIYANLGFYGMYDNGHEFIALDRNNEYTEVVEFENTDEAVKYVKDNEPRYLEIMDDLVNSYKKNHKVFDTDNLECFVNGFVDIHVDDKFNSQITVFHHDFKVVEEN